MTDPDEEPQRAYEYLDIWMLDARQLLIDAGYSEYATRIPHIRIAIGCHPHNAN